MNGVKLCSVNKGKVMQFQLTDNINYTYYTVRSIHTHLHPSFSIYLSIYAHSLTTTGNMICWGCEIKNVKVVAVWRRGKALTLMNMTDRELHVTGDWQEKKKKQKQKWLKWGTVQLPVTMRSVTVGDESVTKRQRDKCTNNMNTAAI